MNTPNKFCSKGLFFKARGSLTSLKSQTRDPWLNILPRRLVLRIFYVLKNTSTSARFEPTNLGSRGEHVIPKLPSLTSIYKLIFQLVYITLYLLLIVLYFPNIISSNWHFLCWRCMRFRFLQANCVAGLNVLNVSQCLISIKAQIGNPTPVRKMSSPADEMEWSSL